MTWHNLRLTQRINKAQSMPAYGPLTLSAPSTTNDVLLNSLTGFHSYQTGAERVKDPVFTTISDLISGYSRKLCNIVTCSILGFLRSSVFTHFMIRFFTRIVLKCCVFEGLIITLIVMS